MVTVQPKALRGVDPFVVRDHALEMRSQYLSHIARLVRDALRRKWLFEKAVLRS
jgi:hypothetical protein